MKHCWDALSSQITGRPGSGPSTEFSSHRWLSFACSYIPKVLIETSHVAPTSAISGSMTQVLFFLTLASTELCFFVLLTETPCPSRHHCSLPNMPSVPSPVLCMARVASQAHRLQTQFALDDAQSLESLILSLVKTPPSVTSSGASVLGVAHWPNPSSTRGAFRHPRPYCLMIGT